MASGTERATRVCGTCKARKKACDKLLPQCSSCSRKGISCSYDYESPAGANASLSSSSSSGQPSASPLISGLWPGMSTVGHGLQLVVDPSRPEMLNSALDNLVGHALRSQSLALPGLCNRYFSTFHKAIPIISPSLQQDIEEETGDSLPPAATSVLVLAMCLILFRPSSAGSNDSAREHSITPDALYVAVKTAFAHVQAFVPASTRLVQAGLLLSIFECQSDRVQEAYLSIGTVVRMSHVLGLDSDVKVLAKPCQKDLEEWNVWWGVVIMERLISFAATDGIRLPESRYPPRSAPLPLDLVSCQAAMAETSGILNQDVVQPRPLPAVVSKFGRQAQATSFLDYIQGTVALPVAIETKIVELKQVDQELQAFLSTTLSESTDRPGYGNGSHCGAIAITIQSLFMLHNHILALPLPASMAHAQEELRDTSNAALETIAKITADAARHHVDNLSKEDIDALPSCCHRNFDAAKHHMINGHHHNITSDLKSIKDMESILSRRWKPGVRLNSESQEH